LQSSIPAYQIDTLARAGVTDITLSLSYQLRDRAQLDATARKFGVKLNTRSSATQWHRCAYKLRGLDSRTTVVFNGDILTDLV